MTARAEGVADGEPRPIGTTAPTRADGASRPTGTPGRAAAGTDPDPPAAAPRTKAEWRAVLLAARAAVSPERRRERAAALAPHVHALATETGGPVCAYLPVGSEPGSLAALDALREVGIEILLPVVPTRPGSLDWARYEGPDALAPGPLGLREPAGPRLGPDAIARARLVLVPALAADRAGTRLGRGGGYYDRTLPLAGPATPLVVVLDDAELLDALPAEAHDRPVTAAVRPTAGVTMLGNTRL